MIAGCSHRLTGTYLPKGDSAGGLVLNKLEFISGSEVNLYMMQQVIRANYKVQGKQVLLIINGQQELFNVDSDRCLDGGSMVGKYCKG